MGEDSRTCCSGPSVHVLEPGEPVLAENGGLRASGLLSLFLKLLPWASQTPPDLDRGEGSHASAPWTVTCRVCSAIRSQLRPQLAASWATVYLLCPDAGEVTAGDAVRCEPRTSTSRSGSCAAGVGDPEPVSGALQGCKIVLRAGSGLWPVDRPRPRMPKPASVR